ncbi:hypothetical protein Z517_11179 [Fonsecaea pedrosoi CBS 271.37]|uniref:VOC domain-containing protein n=1 Tax=Fonsecaea pedrosoi CBS 271.37 TaxID=1442368 RepID=A0A0D2G722_9EURO|nr:uncharacterized protein Z517_11179 [Fonsecaea pedrosoi CBS 271.37]KIW76433.1 hypothetical protein Z517_11179 [Fonsecaea pedrosoi CBS 271.37]
MTVAPGNLIALLAVQQNVSDLQKQLNLYGNIDYVVDEGAELADGYQPPDSWFAARGVARDDLEAAVAVKLPTDPYMHVWFYSWKNLDTKSQWPQKFNQIGSRGLTLLFDDVDKELARILKEFPNTKVLQQPIKIQRKWGETTSALVHDPEGTFVELVSIANNPLVAKAQPALPHHRSFLHFMMNCVNFQETTKWYQAFGMDHDHGVDFRNLHHDDQFNRGIGGRDVFMNQMKTFSHHENVWTDCHFLRSPRDPSHMHLELLEADDCTEGLKDPGLNPTWFQKGIARYCMKTPSFEAAQRTAKERGYKIYIEEQRGALNWGDSQWFFFGDVDGNLLTLEQWHHQRYWGERD